VLRALRYDTVLRVTRYVPIRTPGLTILSSLLNYHITTYCVTLGYTTPSQVGVSGGVRPSMPAAAPSGGGAGRCTAERAGCSPPSSGSTLSGTSLKSFQRSYLGTFPKFLQRSQQLVWWKLPSSTYMSREVHPVIILTKSALRIYRHEICWP
jgi:hypothetical protein